MILSEIPNYDDTLSRDNSPFVNILVNCFMCIGVEYSKRIVEAIIKRKLISKQEYINKLYTYSNIGNICNICNVLNVVNV